MAGFLHKMSYVHQNRLKYFTHFGVNTTIVFHLSVQKKDINDGEATSLVPLCYSGAIRGDFSSQLLV